MPGKLPAAHTYHRQTAPFSIPLKRQAVGGIAAATWQSEGERQQPTNNKRRRGRGKRQSDGAATRTAAQAQATWRRQATFVTCRAALTEGMEGWNMLSCMVTAASSH